MLPTFGSIVHPPRCSIFRHSLNLESLTTLVFLDTALLLRARLVSALDILGVIDGDVAVRAREPRTQRLTTLLLRAHLIVTEDSLRFGDRDQAVGACEAGTEDLAALLHGAVIIVAGRGLCVVDRLEAVGATDGVAIYLAMKKSSVTSRKGV